MPFRAACLLLALLCLPVSGAFAAERMQPGQWEITSTLEMPGMPFQPPPQTIRHCYSAAEVSQAPVPAADPSCKVTSLKENGNKVSWSVVCSGDVNGSGKGEIVYRNDSAYSGTMTMTAEGMAMTTRYQAKRIGDCQ